MCALFVAVVFACGVFGHGFDEGTSEHASSSSVLALTAPAAVHGSPADALCGHVHSEHHQLAPCHLQQGGVQRHAKRVVYASFNARAATYEAAPPHGPPRV